jgi:Transposase DDE domain
VECARSREAVRRSELAGWAEYGYCVSHSRYFWGLRLHLLATLHGLPIGFALTGAKADERTVLLDILHTDPTPCTPRPGQILIGDKNYFGAEFEATLAEAGLTLLRPARKGEPDRAGSRFSSPCARPSNRSSTPTRASSTSKATAARPHRCPGPRPATHPRPDHRDLAQRPHRPAHQTLTAGLRPGHVRGGGG